MFLLLIVLSACSGYALAHGIYPGACEVYKVGSQQNFNFVQLMGTWYEVMHSVDPITKGKQEVCTTIALNRVNIAEATILVSEIGINNTSLLQNGTVAKENVSSTDGVLLFKLGSPTYKKFVVVTTDYNGYALIWLCKNVFDNTNEIKSQQQLLVWSRTDQISPPELLDFIDATKFTNNLRHLNLTKTEQGKVRCSRNVQPINGTSNGTHVIMTNGTHIITSNGTHLITTNGTYVILTNGTQVVGNGTKPTANGTTHGHPVHGTPISSMSLVTHGSSYVIITMILTILFFTVVNRI